MTTSDRMRLVHLSAATGSMRHAHSLRYPTPGTDVLWFDPVQQTAHVQPASIQHRRIHHGGFHIFMPEEFLHGSDVVALLKELRREPMSAGMAADAFVEPHRTPCLLTAFCKALSLV
jgi:hypothetical protein